MMRPYVDRPIADGVAASRAARIAAERWGLRQPETLRVGMNAIFRCGEVVLRVSCPTAPARLSLELARLLTAHGVEVPLPAREQPIEAEGMSVTAWPFVEEEQAGVDWRRVGEQLASVHQIHVDELPYGLPTPSPVDFAWWDFERLLADVTTRLDEAARIGIESALDRNAGWDSFGELDVVVCHGDVHPGNVMQGPSGPVLIDWDLLCLAPSGWDHAPMMTWAERWGGEPGWYDEMAVGYGRSMRGDRWAERFAELRLLAATLMRVKASMQNEAAWPEADRRLALWRGDGDAPVWQAL